MKNIINNLYLIFVNPYEKKAFLDLVSTLKNDNRIKESKFIEAIYESNLPKPKK